jgi:hypothetical protein
MSLPPAVAVACAIYHCNGLANGQFMNVTMAARSAVDHEAVPTVIAVTAVTTVTAAANQQTVVSGPLAEVHAALPQ